MATQVSDELKRIENDFENWADNVDKTLKLKGKKGLGVFTLLPWFDGAAKESGEKKISIATTDQVDKYTKFLYNNIPPVIPSENKPELIKIINDMRAIKKLSPLGGLDKTMIIGIIVLLIVLGGGGYYFISKKKTFSFGKRK